MPAPTWDFLLRNAKFTDTPVGSRGRARDFALACELQAAGKLLVREVLIVAENLIEGSVRGGRHPASGRYLAPWTDRSSEPSVRGATHT